MLQRLGCPCLLVLFTLTGACGGGTPSATQASSASGQPSASTGSADFTAPSGAASSAAAPVTLGSASSSAARPAPATLNPPSAPAASAGSVNLASNVPAGTPEAFVTLEGDEMVTELTLAGQELYWLFHSNQWNAGGIAKADLANGKTSLLFRGGKGYGFRPWSLSVANQRAYFVSDENTTVTADNILASIGTGQANWSALAKAEIGRVLVDDQSIYWTEGAYLESQNGTLVPGALKKIPLAGGAAATLASLGAVTASAFAQDGSHLYLALNGRAAPGKSVSSSIKRFAKEGGAAQDIGPGKSALGFSVVAGSLQAWDWASRFALPVGGGPVTEIAKRAQLGGEVTFGAADSTHFYFIDRKNGRLSRQPLAGGQVDILVEHLAEPLALLVTPTHVYWGEAAADGKGNHRIMRLKK